MPTGDYAESGEHSELKSAVSRALSAESSYFVSSSGPITEWSNGPTFAHLVELRKWADLTLLLPRPVPTSRARDIKLILPTGWAHTLRIYSPDEIDDDVAGWLVEARDLATGVAPLLEDVAGLPRGLLERFSANFTADVVAHNRQLFVVMPDMVRAALGESDRIEVNVGGIEYRTNVQIVDDTALVPVDDLTGLEAGRSTEVSLKVRV